MAINLTTLENTLQTKINATTSSDQSKELFLLSKAIESAVGNVTISNLQAEGATQISNIQSASAIQSMKKASVAMALIFG